MTHWSPAAARPSQTGRDGRSAVAIRTPSFFDPVQTTPPFAPRRYRTTFFHLELPPGEELSFRAGAFVQVTSPPGHVRFTDIEVAPEYRKPRDVPLFGHIDIGVGGDAVLVATATETHADYIEKAVAAATEMLNTQVKEADQRKLAEDYVERLEREGLAGTRHPTMPWWMDG